jgi:hypothetical protein
MVDYRTESQVSALRALANGIGSDKSTVKELPLKDKKPERTNLKKWSLSKIMKVILYSWSNR